MTKSAQTKKKSYKRHNTIKKHRNQSHSRRRRGGTASTPIWEN